MAKNLNERLAESMNLLKNGWKQYCSNECRNNNKKIKCNCANCGKELYKTPSEIKRSKTGNVFCNKSCAASFNNSHYRIGNNNPNWKGGTYTSKTHTRIAYRKYVHECAMCGTNEECVLEVHHIDENHENNNEDNLIILCSNCHSRVHRGSYTITDEIKLKRKLK